MGNLLPCRDPGNYLPTYPHDLSSFSLPSDRLQLPARRVVLPRRGGPLQRHDLGRRTWADGPVPEQETEGNGRRPNHNDAG